MRMLYNYKITTLPKMPKLKRLSLNKPQIAKKTQMIVLLMKTARKYRPMFNNKI